MYTFEYCFLNIELLIINIYRETFFLCLLFDSDGVRMWYFTSFMNILPSNIGYW